MTEETNDIRNVIRNVIEEFVKSDRSQSEPAYKAELIEERKRREQLEERLNHLVEENRRHQAIAEEAERGSAIRAELQRLGVAKIDLAYRAVKEDVYRAEDGRLVAREHGAAIPAGEYLAHFVAENPELLPARIPGGSGAANNPKSVSTPKTRLDFDRIRPGMDPEELERVRQEVSRVALEALRGE